MFDPWTAGLEGWKALLGAWTEATSRSMSAAAAAGPDAATPEGLRKIRAAAIEAWAGAWDQFARSPAFLDAMRRTMGGAAATPWTDGNPWSTLAQAQEQCAAAGWQGLEQAAAAAQQVQRHMLRQTFETLEAVFAQLRQLGGRLATVEDELARARPPRRERARRHAGKNGNPSA